MVKKHVNAFEELRHFETRRRVNQVHTADFFQSGTVAVLPKDSSVFCKNFLVENLGTSMDERCENTHRAQGHSFYRGLKVSTRQKPGMLQVEVGNRLS